MGRDATADDDRRAEQLADRIGERAAEAGATVAVAESLTGGLVTEALARAEGSSEWLAGGLVAYSRSVKHDVLGVTADRVVSEQAAREMAAGARRTLGADVAVSVTGVGGPSSQDDEPPGSVWVGVASADGVDAEHHDLAGEPAQICAAARVAALEALARTLR